MSLLQQLGLGGLLGSYPSPNYGQQQGQMLGGGYAIPVYLCPHGTDCPMCLENAKKLGEEVKRREELLTQKKLAYTNRCKDYMIKFRGK